MKACALLVAAAVWLLGATARADSAVTLPSLTDAATYGGGRVLWADHRGASIDVTAQGPVEEFRYARCGHIRGASRHPRSSTC